MRFIAPIRFKDRDRAPNFHVVWAVLEVHEMHFSAGWVCVAVKGGWGGGRWLYLVRTWDLLDLIRF